MLSEITIIPILLQFGHLNLFAQVHGVFKSLLRKALLQRPSVALVIVGAVMACFSFLTVKFDARNRNKRRRPQIPDGPRGLPIVGMLATGHFMKFSINGSIH